MVFSVFLVAVLVGTSTSGAGQLPGLGDPQMNEQWGLTAINAPHAWQTTTGGSDVVIALVDSGVELTHLDLNANLWDGNAMHGTSTAEGWNTYNEHVGVHNTTMDTANQGTIVAGVSSAVADNGFGIRGVAQNPLMVVKVWGPGAPGWQVTYQAGIEWAVDNGADVILIPLTVRGVLMREAMEYAWCAGVVVVAATGGASSPDYPATDEKVIGVGGVDRDLVLSERSSDGADLYAPGEEVLSTGQFNRIVSATGTGVAAPFVAGTAALLLSAYPQLSNVDVMEILLDSGKTVNGLDAPFLDAGAAMDAAALKTPTAGPDCT